MPDLSLSVTLSRNQLSLSDLEINDHDAFYVSSQFLGGNIAWNRHQVTSPFIDGAVTTLRNLEMTNEQVVIEVLGETTSELYANIAVLITAVSQDNYVMTVTQNSQVIQYQCEASDYQIGWNGPRFVGGQIQVQLSMPRQPLPITGGF